MADDSINSRGVFDVSYNAESKTSSLKAKIAVLEKKNRQLIHENEVIIKERTEKLKQAINTSSNEKTELQKRVDELESETARVAELEGELSQLRDNLSKSLNDLVYSNSEASLLRSTMVGLKSSENEKEIKIQAIEEEKNLLILKVEKLEASRDNQEADKKLKEQQITYFKNSVVNLEASVVINQDWDKEKGELEIAKKEAKARVDEMKGRVLEIEKKLEDMERLHPNGIPGTFGFK
nr:sporulation-specific protein 15-like [Ipomoea trifida]